MRTPVGLLGLVIALAGCAGPAQPHASAPGARRAAGTDARVVRQAHPPRLAHDAPPCRSGVLAVSRTYYAGAMGNEAFAVYLRNRVGRTCLEAGYPTLTALTRTGPKRLHVRRGGYFPAPGPTANVQSGHVVAVVFSGGHSCVRRTNGRNRVYPRLRIGLPGGGSVGVRSHFDTVCGISASRFGVPRSAGRTGR
jgi:hypothetical protein